jgi:alkanesulfonate monooxygenase
MPVDIAGLVTHNAGTPLYPAPQDAFSVDEIVAMAKAQEAAGYDRVLIANTSLMPDCNTIGSFVAANTTRLGLLLAHRPGFMAPTMGARMLATVDQLSKGRVTVHIIAGPSDKEVQADGDFTTKEQRYARAREYVAVMRKTWTSAEPFDHEGEFYRFNQAFASIKPHGGGAIPVSWAGTSDASLDACGASADLFAMSGDSLANIRSAMDRADAAAAVHGRTLQHMMTLLAIIGDTEEEAWAKADRVLEEFLDMKARNEAEVARGPSNFGAQSHGTVQQLITASRGARQDRCLWTGVTEAAQGRYGNQSTLVGTPEQVTGALMDYYDMGVKRFLIRGFRPRQDIAEYGEKLFPMLRQAAAQHDGPVSAVERQLR